MPENKEGGGIVAIEQSCFQDAQSIRDFVEKTYGLKVETVKKLDAGSANCFQLSANGQSFFLKEFQEHFDKAALEREVCVCALVSRVVPTSQFMQSLDGAVVCESQGHLFHLQRFLAGKTYPQNQFDGPLLIREAEMLGKIHRCLEGRVDLPEGFPAPWFDTWSKERTIEKYEKICKNLTATEPPLRRQLMEACQIKRSLLQTFELDYKKLKQLTTVNSHGDYNNLQILVDEGCQISAVIDFSSAARLPAVWELMRSYTLSAAACAGGTDLELENFKSYLDAYLAIRPLPLFDIVHMAEFYYFDLLRSSFGFTAKDEATMKFAVWRTKMCAYLGENLDKITAFLRETYQGILH